MSSSFTFERESILRPSIDCLFKAREKEEQKKCRQAAAATVEKLWNFVCCRACRIAAHTNKTHTHLHRHTCYSLLPPTHTHTWQYWKLIWTLGSRQKTICKMKEKKLNRRWFPPCRNSPYPILLPCLWQLSLSTASCALDCCNETSNFVAIKT